MSLWRQLTRGLRALVNRPAADRDIADEVAYYLEQATLAHQARGLPPAEALRAARLELGSVATVAEQVRSAGWEHRVETLLTDLGYAIRRLRAEPAFAAVTVLTLALGLGSATAIFSAVNPILFRRLPYPHGERIMMIWDAGQGGTRVDLTFGTFREVAERDRSFAALAVMKPWQPTLIGLAEPERLEGQSVSAGYFQVLGIPPALGRGFQSSEDQAGGARAVILSDALWRRRFGADRAIIGRSITLDDTPFVVVGVLPKGFVNLRAPGAEMWTPLQYDMSQGRAWGHHLQMIGRLRPGIGVDQARRELDQIAATPVGEFPRVPWASVKNGFLLNSLQDDLTRGARPALLSILGAVVLVLLIACVNVTNLLLARGVRRRSEFALRAALGAGQGRLIRQLLTESLLLAALGGLAGMGVALLGIRALIALSPPGLPLIEQIAFDGSAFAFGAGLTTLIGLAFGAVPALQAARSAPHEELQRGSRRMAGDHRHLRGVLVVAEVALALVLLVGSGLLFRSFQRLVTVDPGFEPSQLITMQVQTSGHRFDDDSVTVRYFREVLEVVRQVPGVTAAALTSQLPLSGDFDVYGVRFEPNVATDDDQSPFRYAVSPGYVEAMQIPLRRGRLLAEADGPGAPRVALISESLAQRRLPGVDPIGQRLRIGDSPLYMVIGMVGDVKQASLALNEAEAVYIPESQSLRADRVRSLVVRGHEDLYGLLPAIRRAVWSVDKDQPIVRVIAMDALLAASAAERRFALILFEAFGLAALGLAAAGIYGVLSGTVAERTRELGIRAALGATRGEILSLVLRHGMTLTGIGVVIGLAGAALASQVLVTLLFGVSPLDPVTYTGVILLLAAVAVIACAVPAWRAARVDPVSTLRAE